MNIFLADKKVIDRVFMRKRNPYNIRDGVNLERMLKQLIGWAVMLIPSEACSIMFDDPVCKLNPDVPGRLYFTACYGANSEALVGSYISDNQGIAGETYKNSRSYICRDT